MTTALPYDEVYEELIHDDGYWKWNPGKRPEVHKDTMEALKLARAKTVLDAGCGRGDLARRLAVHGMEMTASDVADCSRYVAIANTNLAHPIIFEQCELPKIPNGPFDAVVCVDVLEHLHKDDALQAIKNFFKQAEYAYLRIACFPSHRGRHKVLHLTIETPFWWMDRVKEMATLIHFSVHQKGGRKDRDTACILARRR